MDLTAAGAHKDGCGVGNRYCVEYYRTPQYQGVINSVQAAYSGKFIRWMLLNIEMKRPMEVSLFMALEMLAAAQPST